MPDIQIQRESLEEQANHVLEECRIIVPGIQALIGFQMVAILNDGFYTRLTSDVQKLHFFDTCLSVVSMFLLLAPSAYQRIAEAGFVSSFFTKLASHLIFAAMATLRLVVTLDIFVLSQAIGFDRVTGELISSSLFIFGWILWSGGPRLIRYLNRRAI